MGITKKTLMITASAALTVATAVPALALENEFHGMFRLFGAVSNFNASDTVTQNGVGFGFYLPQGLDKKSPTATYLAQRARLMYIAKANDNLKLVTHFEIDSRWGDASYNAAGRNSGGAIGADAVNIETKSVYLDFNCPITGANVKVGMQPYDDAFKGVLFGADMAGLLASRSFGSLDAAAGFFRFDDKETVPGKKTRDMVAATAKYAVTKDIKIGGAYYFIDDDRSDNYDYVYQEQGNTNTDLARPRQTPC